MPVRVLIVDDSPIMRGLLSRALRMDPEIEIVGTANDPYEARKAIKQRNPDVITLDVEMPRMNGLVFLEKLMRLRPMPVVMVSTLTQKGANAAIQALSLGAIECYGKPENGNGEDLFKELAQSVKAAARAKIRSKSAEPAKTANCPANFQPNGNILAIGSSTGGVETLTEILQNFPENCPPTIIVQHMPALFTSCFAARLNKQFAPTIMEAKDGAPMKPGHVYIAPGGVQHTILEAAPDLRCRLIPADPVNGHRPSVDVMLDSAAKVAGRKVVGTILTGMGRDGAKGLLQVREAGGATFGQDEATSVIYGMPKAAFEIGAVAKQLPLHKIAPALLNACNTDLLRRGAA